MKENLTGLARLAKDEATYAYNWGVGKVVGLIALAVTYLLALWGCMWVGYGTLNIVMWVFILMFSLMYWKGIGGIAALGEFFYPKDKPEKKPKAPTVVAEDPQPYLDRITKHIESKRFTLEQVKKLAGTDNISSANLAVLKTSTLNGCRY